MRRPMVAGCIALALVLALPGASLASARPDSSSRASAGAATKYRNCKALNAKYPHGVGRKGAKDHVSSGTPVTTFKVNNALYEANRNLDRDKDGIACEKR